MHPALAGHRRPLDDRARFMTRSRRSRGSRSSHRRDDRCSVVSFEYVFERIAEVDQPDSRIAERSSARHRRDDRHRHRDRRANRRREPTWTRRGPRSARAEGLGRAAERRGQWRASWLRPVTTRAHAMRSTRPCSRRLRATARSNGTRRRRAATTSANFECAVLRSLAIFALSLATSITSSTAAAWPTKMTTSRSRRRRAERGDSHRCGGMNSVDGDDASARRRFSAALAVVVVLVALLTPEAPTKERGPADELFDRPEWRANGVRARSPNGVAHGTPSDADGFDARRRRRCRWSSRPARRWARTKCIGC